MVSYGLFVIFPLPGRNRFADIGMRLGIELSDGSQPT